MFYWFYNKEEKTLKPTVFKKVIKHQYCGFFNFSKFVHTEIKITKYFTESVQSLFQL